MTSKQRAFLVVLKLQALEVAEKTSEEAAARQFGVDLWRIRKWCSQMDHLAKQPFQVYEAG